MDVLLFILLVALNGLIIGALGRLLLPGPDPMGLLQTILTGIAGSTIAGLIAYYAFDESGGAGLLLAVIVTVGLVYLLRRMRRGRADERPAGV